MVGRRAAEAGRTGRNGKVPAFRHHADCARSARRSGGARQAVIIPFRQTAPITEADHVRQIRCEYEALKRDTDAELRRLSTPWDWIGTAWLFVVVPAGALLLLLLLSGCVGLGCMERSPDGRGVSA